MRDQRNIKIKQVKKPQALLLAARPISIRQNDLTFAASSALCRVLCALLVCDTRHGQQTGKLEKLVAHHARDTKTQVSDKGSAIIVPNAACHACLLSSFLALLAFGLSGLDASLLLRADAPAVVPAIPILVLS